MDKRIFPTVLAFVLCVYLMVFADMLISYNRVKAHIKTGVSNGTTHRISYFGDYDVYRYEGALLFGYTIRVARK